MLFLISWAHSIELSLKLSGGLSYINLKNTNRTLQDWSEWQKREADYRKNWSFLGGEVRGFHSGFDFEGEIIVSFTPHLAAGVGTGYIHGELNEEKTEITLEKVLGTYIYVRPTKVSAFPLTLSGYYFFPLKKVNFFIKGGAGIIWAKYIDREGNKKTSATKFAYHQLQRTSAKGSTLFGGLGIMYDMEPGMRFFVEGSARLAKISGFHGENKEGDTGILYFFEEYDPDLDFWQAKNRISADEPSGENIRSVEEATVDFSGFSVKIGIIIKF